uniref:tRNA wybutosine-synthesizing protein 3 homolog n=1 Tax=Callorhinchus milii TaxID=7868 RepID=V9L6I7_CALMI
MERFGLWKRQRLSGADLSRKGAVDQEISHVVGFVNGSEQFFTTSSCSGRTLLIDSGPNVTKVQKQACSWLFVTHQKCRKEDVVTGLQKTCNDAVFKFEPFVLHVQCRQLEDAQLLHSVAINAGFRNSGITVGKKGKIMMAVRSTHCLEVPLCHKGRLLVNDEYIDYLVQVANQKMEENQRRIERFHVCLQSALSAANHAKQPGLEENKVAYVNTSRRRKENEKVEKNEKMDNDADDEIDLGFLMSCS